MKALASWIQASWGRAVGTASLRLIPLFAEPVLAKRPARDLPALGGHAVASAYGAGPRGMRAGDRAGEGARIEGVVPSGVSERILAHVAEHDSALCAVIAFVTDVEVARGEECA